MIEILTKGKAKAYTLTCKDCGTIFRCNPADTYLTYYLGRMVNCPICGAGIHIPKEQDK